MVNKSNAVFTTLKIFFSVFLCALLIACTADQTSSETKIKNIIEEMEVAAQERNRRGVTEYISERFSGEGVSSKKEVENLIRGYLIRNANINIWTNIRHIKEITPQEYQVELVAAMASKGVNLDNETERLKADLHRFELTFVDIEGDGDWQIEFAKWQRGF